MSSNFNLYSKYYNLLYADKDYKSESGYIQRLIKKYSPNGKTILDLGSGTGKHGLELKKNGYDVFGIERSEGMVAEATTMATPRALCLGQVLGQPRAEGRQGTQHQQQG